MVEVPEVEDGVVIIDCVAIFYEEGEGGEHYRNKNKFGCRVSRIEKRLVKVKEKIWQVCLLPAWCVRVEIAACVASVERGIGRKGKREGIFPAFAYFSLSPPLFAPATQATR